MRCQLGAGLLAALLGAGCVVERSPTQRLGLLPPKDGAKQRVSLSPQEGSNAPVDLSRGPIATPVTNASLVSRITVSVKRLGSIVYDGQVLPLASPAGDLIAVQEGEAPQWSNLLAADDAPPAPGVRVVAYRITATNVERIEWSGPSLNGMLLGRNADSEGFLVESALAAGSRAIGKVNWATGELRWIAGEPRPDLVAAHGTLLPQGSMAFIRRRPGDAVSELVLRSRDGAESVRRDNAANYAFPLPSADPAVLYALLITDSGIDLEAISARIDSSGTRFGGTIARRRIATFPDAALAYQIAQSVGSNAGSGFAQADANRARIALFHPVMGRTVVFDPREGVFAPLAPTSNMVIPWRNASSQAGAEDERGYFCVTPKGVTFAGDPAQKRSTATPKPRNDARVLTGLFAARPTNDPLEPLLLFAPDPSDSLRLGVLKLGVGGVGEGDEASSTAPAATAPAPR